MSKKNEKETVVPFTGIARSVVCVNNQGFKNLKIVTLYIEDGKVVSKELSDPYVNFEAIARMDIMNTHQTMSLNQAWEDGKAWFQLASRS